MLEFCIEHQIIKRKDLNIIVANSSDYLTAEFNFSNDWRGLEKTAIFTNKDGSIAIPLDRDNMITKDRHLNLSSGTWIVSVYGVYESEKIITNVCSVTVSDSGASDGTIPPEPTPDLYDQIATRLSKIEAQLDYIMSKLPS